MFKWIKIILIAIVSFILVIAIYFTIVVVRARMETPRIIRTALQASNITLEANDLSEWQLHALLAVEDPNFYKYKGVDLKTPGAGITTITQSLVKKYYFEHFKPGIAKIKQTLIARYALDPLVSKDDQLKLFINNIYLGNVNGEPVIGFDNAARVYYHKKIARLSEMEYLSIIAMIIAPVNFHLFNRPEVNAERTGRLAKVVSGEYKPIALMDIYYGRLDQETQKGLPDFLLSVALQISS